MATHQGTASAWERKGKILLTADSLLGGWTDERGVVVGATSADREAFSYVLPSESSDELLGSQLRAALLASRIDRPSNWFDQSQAGSGAQALAGAFGLKSSNSIYGGMRHASIAWALGEITLHPTRRRRGAHFDYSFKDVPGEHGKLIIPFDTTDQRIGATLRECLCRCL